MRDRHRRLMRLLAAAEHLKRMQELKVRELEAAHERLRERQRVLLEAFGGDVCRDGQMARMLRRNLELAAREAREAEAEKAGGARLLRHRNRQTRQIERLARASAAKDRAGKEKKALLDVIERDVNHGGGQVSRKFGPLASGTGSQGER